MNYLVHCVMYFYYFLSALGYRPVWAPVVTVMQISQMFVGVAMCVLVYRYSKDGGSCAVSHANYIAGLLMYVVRDHALSSCVADNAANPAGLPCNAHTLSRLTLLYCTSLCVRCLRYFSYFVLFVQYAVKRFCKRGPKLAAGKKSN